MCSGGWTGQEQGCLGTGVIPGTKVGCNYTNDHLHFIIPGQWEGKDIIQNIFGSMAHCVDPDS